MVVELSVGRDVCLLKEKVQCSLPVSVSVSVHPLMAVFLLCCITASICQFVTLAWRCSSAASCTLDWRVHIIHFNIYPPSPSPPPLLPSSIGSFLSNHIFFSFHPSAVILHSFLSSHFPSFFASPLLHPSSLPHLIARLCLSSLVFFLSFSQLVFKLADTIRLGFSDKLA